MPFRFYRPASSANWKELRTAVISTCGVIWKGNSMKKVARSKCNWAKMANHCTAVAEKI